MQEKRPSKEMLAQILGMRTSGGQARQTSTSAQRYSQPGVTNPPLLPFVQTTQSLVQASGTLVQTYQSKVPTTSRTSMTQTTSTLSRPLVQVTNSEPLLQSSQPLVRMSMPSVQIPRPLVQTTQSSVSNLHLPSQSLMQTSQSILPTAGISQHSTHSQPLPLPRPCANPGYYILTLLGFCHPNVSDCYGCQQSLKINGQQTLPPPLDLVVATKMRREYFSNERKMSRMGNVYFHCNMHCLRSKLPFFHPSLLQLQPGLHAFLRDAHKNALHLNFGLELYGNVSRLRCPGY